MRFLLALLVTVAMGVVLGVGILSAVHGNSWVLIVGGLAYLLAFARLGCLPRSAH